MTGNIADSLIVHDTAAIGGQYIDGLGCVDGRTAADRYESIRAGLCRDLVAFLDHFICGVGDNAVKLNNLEFAAVNGRDDLISNSYCLDALVINDHDGLGAEMLQNAGQLQNRVFSECNITFYKKFLSHSASPFFYLYSSVILYSVSAGKTGRLPAGPRQMTGSAGSLPRRNVPSSSLTSGSFC